jgi:hypothetical protein
VPRITVAAAIDADYVTFNHVAFLMHTGEHKPREVTDGVQIEEWRDAPAFTRQLKEPASQQLIGLLPMRSVGADRLKTIPQDNRSGAAVSVSLFASSSPLHASPVGLVLS